MKILKKNSRLWWVISMTLTIFSESSSRELHSTQSSTTSLPNLITTSKDLWLQESFRLNSLSRVWGKRAVQVVISEAQICLTCIQISNHNKILDSMCHLQWIWVHRVRIPIKEAANSKEVLEICLRISWHQNPHSVQIFLAELMCISPVTSEMIRRSILNTFLY